MINTDELREILDKIPYEKSAESFEDVFSIVYRRDNFQCSDVNIHSRHIDIEYTYGSYYEIYEGSNLYEYIFTLCNLQDEDMILYQKK